jgi:DNA segregation ATPase FtsK/SpoIIIE, S-DNA-T family
LSWIKKIFTVFQNDDNDLDDIAKEQAAKKPLKPQQNQKKDLQARVLYQYPKGQFRFPLIPDDQVRAEKVKKSKTTSEKVQPVPEVKPLSKEKGSLRFKEKSEHVKTVPQKARRESTQETQSSIKREAVKETPSKFRYEPRKESGAKFRQPFRPTEIPSPIYAYNRPPLKPKQETKIGEVEYELSGFEHQQEDMAPRNPVTNEEYMTGIEANSPSIKDGLQGTLKEDEALKHESYIIEHHAEALEVGTTQNESETADSQYETEAEALDHILNGIPSQDIPRLDEEADVDDQVSDEVTVSTGENEIIVKEPVEQPASEVSYEPEQLDEGSEQQDGDQFDQEQGKHEPKTRQLPFNVIMLKQDRKKWEERNSSKYPSFMAEGSKTKAASVSSEQQASAVIPEDQADDKTPSVKNELAAAELSAPKDPNWQHTVSEPDLAMEFDGSDAATEITGDSNRQLEVSEHSPGTEQLPINLNEPSEGSGQTIPKKQDKQPETINHNDGMTNSMSAPSPTVSSSTVKHEIASAVEIEAEAPGDYAFPPLNLLSPPVFKEPDPQWLAEQEHMLNETLRNFNVGARVVNMTQGPSVTRFEVQPEPGVKVNKITNLSDDIKLSLAAKDIRIEAPIPGKHTIGIEVPNHSSRPVLLSEILQESGFLEHESPLAVALGLDIAGNPIVTDLKKMPHGLIAGATGSGKSVCINTMLVSLLYKAHPDDVKLLLIDPKMVELAPYNQIPHLVSPVITDVKAATASLKWAVEEMERRYELFAHTGVRDISRFNELAVKHRRFSDKLPFIVIVIDELADLMMMAPADVEEAICRIAQKARACGIHLIIATQRPSVDVITGLIKANVPTRIAFSVSSQVDSRTIIDISGAEKLLGRGDMLFLENGSSKPFRLQGTYVTDNEIDDIVAFAREQRTPQYLFEQEELLRKAQVTEDEDELFYEACEFVVEQGGASTSSVQRRFKIGYNRAARLIEMMEQQGFISEGRGSKPRDVLISAADLESLQDTSTFN